MRKIKFRAWDGSQMRYNILPWQHDFVLEGMSWRCIESNGNGILGSGGTEAKFEIKGYSFDEVMQYIGIKDRNGIEMYEGDIVRHYSKFYEPVKKDPELFESDEIGTIQFKEGCFGFVRIDGKSEMYGVLEDNEDNKLGFEEYWFEVIGNIYENPELIQVKEEG